MAPSRAVQALPSCPMQATGRIGVPSGYLLKDVSPTVEEAAYRLGCISLRGTRHCSLPGHPFPLLSPLLPLHAVCAYWEAVFLYLALASTASL